MNTRRSFVNAGLAAAGLLSQTAKRAAAAPAGELKIGAGIYESIGVRPVINCRGTFTIITGSQSLPEVKQAMMEASKHYVHLDELMNAVGARLAELTKAEWGIVTNGCAAALTHATSACIAGADPEKMQRLPKLDGLKNQVIMPKYARNVYDHAVRMLGVDIVEVNTAEELEAAFNAQTAMVLILSCPAAEKGPLSIANVAPVAKRHRVPLLVNAAAEKLTIPNIHLQHGATMVAYSGGKCMRGPQAAGLLLGPKALLQAAWLNSAPHHAFGRSLKVGKEEIMGMLAAVEMWTRRDHDAEWKQWEAWLAVIAAKVTQVPGVATEILQPEDLSNHAPQLRLKWDAAKVGIGGKDVERLLLEGSPRIVVAGSTAGSLTVMPYMMMPDDHKIAADAIHALLAHPPKIAAPAPPSGQPVQIGGAWNVHLDFLVGEAAHRLNLEQSGGVLSGSHASGLFTGELRGAVKANQVQFRASHRIQGTAIGYDFTGTLENGVLSGTVAMGEYGTARWMARRA